jgi:hypothetical protein
MERAFFYWSSCHRPNVELAVIEQREFELPADSADIGLRKEQLGHPLPPAASLAILRQAKHVGTGI